MTVGDPPTTKNCEVSVERSNDEFKNDGLHAKPADVSLFRLKCNLIMTEKHY